jgi:hypothetical protein
LLLLEELPELLPAPVCELDREPLAACEVGLDDVPDDPDAACEPPCDAPPW